MIPAALVLLTAALVIWSAPFVLLAVLLGRDFFAFRAERRRRAEQARETSPEWLAVLAAVEPTPICDALVCEGIERAEGWNR